MNRPNVQGIDVEEVFSQIRIAYWQALVEKGDGAYASSHEAFGVITEEYHELAAAISKKVVSSTLRGQRSAAAIDAEIMDIIVAGVHSLVSRRTGMDW